MFSRQKRKDVSRQEKSSIKDLAELTKKNMVLRI